MSTTSDQKRSGKPRAPNPPAGVESVKPRPPKKRPTDPNHRIDRLTAANTPPICVAPDTPVPEALTLMLMHNISQVPVMQGDRAVKGVFSWRSYGIAWLFQKPCNVVRECMGRYREVKAEDSLFDVIPLILQYKCVLVRDATNKISGLVTLSDLSLQFRHLAEPFLRLKSIEENVRGLLDRAGLTPEDLQAAADLRGRGRTVQSVDDLSFGGYVRLLQNPEIWDKVGLKVDQRIFVDELDRIRKTRNRVMHFDPEGIDEKLLLSLQRFAKFLNRLEYLLNGT